MTDQVRYCQNPTCYGPDYQPSPWGGDYRRERPEHQRNPLTWSGKGRPPTYCSGPCRQAHYRARAELAALETRQHELEQARYEAERDWHRKTEAIERQVRELIAVELARIPHNSRVSTTQRESLAASIARQLFLGGVINTHRIDVEHKYRMENL